MSRFSPLVIASHNQGKVREIEALLKPWQIAVVSAGGLGLPEPEETGDTFEANAALKALAAAEKSGHWALADDSGLCVEALGGAPGIFSARWAGSGKDFAAASQRIRQELLNAGVEPQGARAYFICVLSLASPQGDVTSFEGRVDGTLCFPARGQKGFGYDPIFIPAGYSLTFAEMEPDAKHAISHRARAFSQFADHVQRLQECEAL